MSNEGTVTGWLHLFRAGDTDSAQQLWERYFAKMVRLAHSKLRGQGRALADEEDVALSAFHSFCRGVENGAFPKLEDRDDLWQVLVLLTARKASRLVRHERAAKRGGGRVFHASALSDDEANALAEILSSEPLAGFAAQLADNYQELLERLRDHETLQAVAVGRFEGYTNAELAERLGISERTVERRLAVIRTLWTEEIDRE